MFGIFGQDEEGKGIPPRHPLAVPAEKLRRSVAPEELGFETTAELNPASGLVGQERALAAIQFGTSIDKEGFNLFVLGPPGLGKGTAVRSYLEEKSRSQPAPSDWVYVNNFKTPYKPTAMSLPQGRGQALKESMIAVIDELRAGLPAMFESDEYQDRRRAIEAEFRERQGEAFEAINRKAKEQSLAVLRTPAGFAIAPTHDGQVIKPEIFNALPEEERKAIESKIEALQSELEAVLEQIPKWEKERRSELRELNEEFAQVVVRQALADVREEFSDLDEVKTHLDQVERDLIQNVALFLRDGSEGAEIISQPPVETIHDARFRRYMVNVIVSNPQGEKPGAPIVEETNPTMSNLVGRIEHIPQMGMLVTDFLLIKPGALHAANGGYLLLDARKVLMQPMAWEGLKRAIKTQKIKIETPAESLGLITTVTLEPDPIPSNVKVVLFGDRLLYYLLSALDPEFPSLFKVAADFNETIERDGDTIKSYAQIIASIVNKHGLNPVDASGVARIIEEGSRLASDAEKLSIRLGILADIVTEANFWAKEEGRSVISRHHIQKAIDSRIHRADRVRELVQESITRDIMLIDTDGAKAGQINGLSVSTLGGFMFGRPNRISARVRLGAGRVTDIEREVELGGPLHSKGVMILWGYLAGQYAPNVPLALAASLVFEQSYTGVEGDSASSAELYALLSALADVPIKQGIAVTGSVNQFGEVQAIGGVNEKIEGFFDICKKRGLTGDQGVIIPKSNLVHLALREDVIEAVRRGAFTVYAVSNADEAMEILTGVPAGQRGEDGLFPPGTINRMVEDKLISLAEARKAFASEHGEDELGDAGPTDRLSS